MLTTKLDPEREVKRCGGCGTITDETWCERCLPEVRETLLRDVRKTVEIKRETIAELLSRIGGHYQAPPVKRCDFYTELADTQALPAIDDDCE